MTNVLYYNSKPLMPPFVRYARQTQLCTLPLLKLPVPQLVGYKKLRRWKNFQVRHDVCRSIRSSFFS